MITRIEVWVVWAEERARKSEQAFRAARRSHLSFHSLAAILFNIPAAPSPCFSKHCHCLCTLSLKRQHLGYILARRVMSLSIVSRRDGSVVVVHFWWWQTL